MTAAGAKQAALEEELAAARAQAKALAHKENDARGAPHKPT